MVDTCSYSDEGDFGFAGTRWDGEKFGGNGAAWGQDSFIVQDCSVDVACVGCGRGWADVGLISRSEDDKR